MQIKPLKIDSLTTTPQGKENSPGKPAEETTHHIAGDTVHLSEVDKAAKTLKSHKAEEKAETPAPVKSKPKAEPQAVPSFITEISEPKGDSPKNKSTMDFTVIKAKEKPFLELKNTPDKDYKVKRDDFYADIFADPSLSNRTESIVKLWAKGGMNLPVIREAYARVVLEGKEPSTDIENTVVDLLTTRKERWMKLGEKLGIEPPEQFHAYRGVTGRYAVDAIVKAWKDDSSKYMNVPNLELSSWSLDKEVAKDFASGTKEPSVVYEADIPFSRTLMDKWVDDNYFITGFYREEEVVVAGTKDSIRIPKEQATVKYQDKIYTYKERAQLFKAMEDDKKPGLLHRISQTLAEKFHDIVGS